MVSLHKACLALMLGGGKANELSTSDELHLSADKQNDANISRQDEGNESRGLRHLDGTTAARLLVDYVYTYGAPSVSDPYISNPGDKCIPGIRAFTEDFSSADPWCSRANSACQLWCSDWNPACLGHNFYEDAVTNTDFASAWNADSYPHPKMSTLVLVERDEAAVQYQLHECDDSGGANDHQSLPGSEQYYDLLGAIHDIDNHYEKRLIEVPANIRGPLLEFASVAWCVYELSFSQMEDCLKKYDEKTNGLPGVGADDWELVAHMNHEGSDDSDTAGVVINRDDPGFTKCIIAFAGSGTVGDLLSFLGSSNDPVSFCGHHGVHKGIAEELTGIMNDDQYEENIKPALETCQQVTCVGHSLGGALCDLFTMCANQGPELLAENGDEQMRAQYETLRWNPTTAGPTASPATAGPTASTSPTAGPTASPTTAGPMASTSPTAGPTAAPATAGPTSAATTAGPTAAPTLCEDDPGWRKKGNSKLSCRSVGYKDTANRCEKWRGEDGAWADDACKKTCDTCGPPRCRDDRDWHREGKPTQSCRTVAKGSTANRCEKWRSEDGVWADDACKETCDTCGPPRCRDDRDWRREGKPTHSCRTVAKGNTANRCENWRSEDGIWASDACKETCETCR